MRRFLIGGMVLLVAACGGQQDAQERGTGTGEAITVGVAGPLTGDYAKFGEALVQGVELAFKEINDAGGVLGRPLEIVKGDDIGRPSEGLVVARNFVKDQDNVVAVLGHFNSGVSKPAGEVYNENKIIMLTPASTNPAVTSSDKPFVFRNLPNDNQNGEMLAQFIVNELGAKRIGIYMANNEYGNGLAEVVKKTAEGLGANVVAQAKFDPATDEDFRPVLTNWKGNNLDVIILACENPKGGQIISQAAEVGLEVEFAGGDGIASSELWEIAGKDAEGVYVVSYFHPGNPSPAVQEFVKKFSAAYGRTPDVWAAQAYDAARLLVDAIKRAGSTNPEDVRMALAATDGWRGVTGPHRFQNGDAVGKRVIITRVEPTEEGDDYFFSFHKEVVPEAVEAAPAATSSATTIPAAVEDEG